jgi:hypothetical protein
LEDGRWKMEVGRWKMEDGRWKMEDGVWRLDDGSFFNKTEIYFENLRYLTTFTT